MAVLILSPNILFMPLGHFDTVAYYYTRTGKQEQAMGLGFRIQLTPSRYIGWMLCWIICIHYPRIKIYVHIPIMQGLS